MADKVKQYLRETQAPALVKTIDRTTISYEKRAQTSTNAMAARLFNIMAKKRTNLCLSVDLTKTTSILDLLENVGEHICLAKTHVDIIEDFSQSFVKQLKQLSEKFNFLIMEDRKFADIGNTVSLQLSKGVYRISEWADLITVHSIPGEGILKGIEAANSKVAVVLLAEMSSADNLFTQEYTEKTAKMAEKYPNIVAGFVCQNKNVFANPGLIQLTPGVQLESAKDNLGQVYNTPEKVMLERGADIAIVGRGIISAKNPKEQAILYKKMLWQCYLDRV